MSWFMIASIILGLVKIWVNSDISLFKEELEASVFVGVLEVSELFADLSSLIFLEGDVTRTGLAVRADIFLIEKLLILVLRRFVGPGCEVSVVVVGLAVLDVCSDFFGDKSNECFSFSSWA